jgi:hypothetical protein
VYYEGVDEPEVKPFSYELEHWLKSPGQKTISDLGKVFAEKSFAVLFFILAIPSALPIPTGGVTNIFEILVIILALEMIAGRRTLWIPSRWKNREISGLTKSKVLNSMSRRIRWLERHTRPRLRGVLAHSMFLRLTGLIILLFALGALVAPPFTGFETLPSLGIVIVALGLILEDAALFLTGALIGSVGIGIEITLSRVVFEFVINYI